MSRNCTTADAYIRIAHTAGGSIATTQDTPAPDVCICFVRLVSICIVLHIHSIPVPVRIPEIRIPGTLLRHVRIVELSTNRPKRITADARSQPARTVKGNTVTIQDTPVPDALMWHVKSAELCTVLLIRSTVVRVREIRTRIILCCIANIAKFNINQLNRITAVA